MQCPPDPSGEVLDGHHGQAGGFGLPPFPRPFSEVANHPGSSRTLEEQQTSCMSPSQMLVLSSVAQSSRNRGAG